MMHEQQHLVCIYIYIYIYIMYIYIYMERASGAGGSDLDLPTTLFLHNSPQTFSGILIHSECFTINVLHLFCQVFRF